MLDLQIPKKNGLDVLHFMNETKMIHNIPVIMITGEATVESDVEAYELGAADIISKILACFNEAKQQLFEFTQNKFRYKD